MPSPTPSDVHVNKPLTNIAVAYMQSAENYVADKVFPIVPVAKQSDRYFVYSKGDLLRDEAQLRAPGTESAGSGVSIDNTPSYFADVYAYHEDVPDQLKANADAPLQPLSDSTENCMQKLLTRRERQWAAGFFTTGIWDLDRQGVAASPTGTQFLQWDAANSDPPVDMASSAATIRKATGFRPNVAVIGAPVMEILRNHTKITDRIKYTQRGIVTMDLLAAVFGVDKVLEAAAVYNTAAEGATATIDWIFGKSVLLCYAAPSPGIRKPSGGYIFSWTGLTGSANGVRTKRFRMEHLESDRVESEMAYSMKLVGADLGVFMYDVIS